MARYATTDPTLSSITADRRQGLSLIAPPNAKRRRTIKKVLVDVKFLPFLITGLLLFSDKSYLVHFQTRTQQSSASEPANAPSTGMTFTTLFLRMNTGIHSYSGIYRGNNGGSTCGRPSVSTSKST
jgi:hypothetical protein